MQNKPAEPSSSGSTPVRTAQPQHPRTYHIQGRQRRSVSATYSLPTEIDPEKANATFKNGILEVHLPKLEQSKPKQVKVNLPG
jgi:HSP20 family protein